MSERGISSCKNPDCRFDVDQTCVEGLSAGDCPNRTVRPLLDDHAGVSDELAEDIDAEMAGIATVDVPKGKRLSPGECASILQNAPSRVVAVIAPRDTGKTSLIVGVYEMFLDGRSKHQFAGSETLWDFERLCHLSRAASGLHTPDMERTRRAEGLGFLHLALQSKSGSETMHILFADRPGEHWTTAADSLEAAASYEEFHSATTVACLIDGEALLDDERRHNAINQTLMILQSLKEAGAFSARPALAIILTKYDVGHSSGQAQKLGLRFDECADAIGTRFAADFHKISRVTTAASPHSKEQLERGFGVAEALDACLMPMPVTPFRPAAATAAREMLRFGSAQRDGS